MMNNIMEILDKLQFFGGQRAGRELWADKPIDVQDADIESFNENIEAIREYIQQLEAKNNVLYHTIIGVMHFVDKWLDVPAYDPDEDLNGTTAVGRASHAREIALQAIEQLEAERDATMTFLRSIGCDTCRYREVQSWEEPCLYCIDYARWQWIGVQKEDAK